MNSEFGLMHNGLARLVDVLAPAQPVPPPPTDYHFHVTVGGQHVEFHSEAELLAFLARRAEAGK